ncbi:MAG: oxidoreductase [Microscillaceae bacterium]|jgi:NAD(P)-dependent dehydrogenase (short-subunit alcohol dehydrogenase family)|nr:oxidoreductase [Microscillaceae bacterium]
MKQKIWFITGISSGLGKSLTEAVLEKGDFVIGTFRQAAQVEAFNRSFAGKALGVLLDITDNEQVINTFLMIQQEFGQIDVLVNNAGFGFAGAIEEADNQEIRAVFEANFFGAWQVTKAALPMMRNQKSGYIFQISSHGGFKAFPGFGIYNAAKFALEGMSEALAAEIAPLGIKLTIVEPGPFRTQFAGASFAEAKVQIADYQATAGVFRARIKGVDGKQEGNPDKAAQAMIDLVNTENPPLRLPLGKIALASLEAKLASVQADLENYRSVAERAVY